MDAKEMNEAARLMLAVGKLDKAEYSKIEDFVLRNQSRLGADEDFISLKSTLDEVARRFNLPTLSSLQENFGLNSCAQ